MNEMELNADKTKVMIFNRSRQYDFLPQLYVEKDLPLEFVEVHKLLGVYIQSDLRWHTNTNNLCSKGYSRLWLLRRLQTLGASIEELLDVYQKQVRSIVELAVPVWEPGLTHVERKQIERVQKAACSIILGRNYNRYSEALSILGLETLSSRRKKLSLNFAKKALRHPRFSTWFQYNTSKNYPIRRQNKLVPVTSRTKDFKSSPLPSLTELLNDFFQSKN